MIIETQPTVVVIEDDPQIRHFVRSTLQTHGLTAVEADTGKSGLSAVATRQPNLVVLDLGLPDVDGMDIVRELRGWPQVPVMVLSARTNESVKVEALDAGAEDYLTKPFGVSELLRACALNCAARHRQQMRPLCRSVKSSSTWAGARCCVPVNWWG